MSRFTKESIVKLKESVDLVDLLSSFISLKKSGAAYKALCPFHDEKTPSFTLQKGDTHYHCFGCGAHGDALSFLMQYERLDFNKALLFLSERYGVALELEEGSSAGFEVSTSKIKNVLDSANRFYHAFLLHSSEAETARLYLQGRGFSLSFIKMFSVGYAPHTAFLLKRYLHGQGFSEKELVQAGLVSLHEGRAREFFSDRIMFPIFDSIGSCIGFSARKYKEETFGGKYINSKESLVFKKAKIFFGILYSKKRIIKEKKVCIVEGQLDALRLIEAGFDYTLATLGTAVTPSHEAFLQALGVEEIYLAFDQDDAGIQNAIKAGQIFMKAGINTKIVSFSGAKDPDELLQKFGKMAWYKAICEAQEYIPFLIHKEKASSEWNNPVHKAKVIQKIAQAVSEWNNPIQVYETMRLIAKLAQVPEETVLLPHKKPLPQTEKIVEKQAAITEKDFLLELDLLRWLISHENAQMRLFCFENISVEDFIYPETKKMFEKCKELDDAKKKISLLDLAADLEIKTMETICAAIEKLPKKTEKSSETVYQLIHDIQLRSHMRKREHICEQMKACSSDEELYTLAKEYDLLKKTPPTLKPTFRT